MNNYTIFSSGDAAITFNLGNYISAASNQKVVAMQQWLQHNKPHGVKDIIVAFSSITITYDAWVVKRKYSHAVSAYAFMCEKLSEAFEKSSIIEIDRMIKHIPVCYEEPFAYDLGFVAGEKQVSIEELVHFHTSEVYRVYMVGFLPGFPYMASVPDRITVSRKPKPRKSVAAGSVGIAGKQTGIYPLNSPGGWQIIGRTPLKLFDKNNPDKLIIKTGDLVKFHPILMKEFVRLSGTN
jgi:inhibitor of KinA